MTPDEFLELCEEATRAQNNGMLGGLQPKKFTLAGYDGEFHMFDDADRATLIMDGKPICAQASHHPNVWQTSHLMSYWVDQPTTEQIVKLRLVL